VPEEKEERHEDRKASDSRQRGCEREARPPWADVSEGLKADQLANLYSEWLEEMPADVDLFGYTSGATR